MTERAMSAFWATHRCHRQQEAAIYCGLCDGENASEGAAWWDVPHEAGCAFLLAKDSATPALIASLQEMIHQGRVAAQALSEVGFSSDALCLAAHRAVAALAKARPTPERGQSDADGVEQ